MKQTLRNACLTEITNIWRSTDEDCRPYSVWISEHEVLPEGVDQADTPVVHAWFLDAEGISERAGADYVRFIMLQSGAPWISGAMTELPSAVLSSRRNRIHEIGIANFALQENGDIYIGFQWGGTFGSGARYRDHGVKNSLVCVQNLWRS